MNAFEVNAARDLKELYRRLQAAFLLIAPDKSFYFQTYLVTEDSSARDKKLMSLLTAAHLANGLQAGVDFCVMSDQKKISE